MSKILQKELLLEWSWMLSCIDYSGEVKLV